MPEIVRVETGQQYELALQIQLAVFCDEQGIPRDTCLQNNELAGHVLAVEGDDAMATARLLELADGVGEIARVAVLKPYRRQGLGHRLVAALEAMAAERKFTEVILHPHRYLEAFYGGQGYVRLDDSVEVVGGHELIAMKKLLRV